MDPAIDIAPLLCLIWFPVAYFDIFIPVILWDIGIALLGFDVLKETNNLISASSSR